MLVIRRKADSTCVGTIAPNMTAEQEIALNVIPNFGGVPNDYEVADITPPIIDPQPPQPTEADYLIDLDFRLSMIELGL